MRWIIVTGLPATGKSTLAQRLAAHYRVPLLAKDGFKEPLLDAAGAIDPARSRQLSDRSFDLLFARLGELAHDGADAVLEGNFRAGEHEARLAALPAARLAQVLCRSDEHERQARLIARRGDPTRHPGHGDAHAARDARNDRFLELPGARLLFDTGAAATGGEALRQRLERWWRDPTGDESP